MSEQKKEDIVSEISSKICEFLGDNSITIVNVLSVCIFAMKTIEYYKNLSGNQKKDIVIDSLKSVISQKNGDSSIVDIIPSFIDTSISIDKRELQININAEKCCLSFCQFMKK